MHPHTARFGVRVAGARDQAPHGPRADEQHVIGRTRSGQAVYAIGGGAPTTLDFPKLKEAQGRLDALRDELAGVFREAGPDYDMDQVKSLNGDSHDKVEWVRQKNTEIDEAKAEVDRLLDIKRGAELAQGDPTAVERVGDEPGQPAKPKSLGRLFIESAAYLQRQGAVGPQEHLDVDVRNTLFETGAGWAPESTRTGDVDLSPERQPSVLDFVPTVPTSQSSVKFMRETTFDDSLVVEKAEGAMFGEAALALTEITLPVEKVPVWLPVTDEQLEDVQGIEAYINGRLTLMLRKRLDLQVLQGTGVTPLLEGTENVTGIQTQAKGTDSIPDAIYKLLVKIRDDADGSGGDGDPNVVFIRATKWQDVRLLKTADGIYIWGSPSEAGPERIWGVPVALTNAVTATKAVAGDYRMHSYLAIKRGIDFQVTNAHSDFFINGKQAVRADTRVAMVHLRPAAFGEVTGL